jgi:flagellar hook-associated protein 3 FlgL
MAALERQIASGQKFERLSDAPVSMRSVIDIDSRLRASEQFGRTIEAARARLATEDSTLQSVTNILSRAREVAVQQGGATANTQTRLAGQVEVQELRAAIIQLANQRQNGAYVFGGAFADLPPLDGVGALDPTFPARGAASYEIGPGILASAAHDAGEVFIDSDVIASLDALDAALGADDSVAIGAASVQLTATISNVQTLVADVGARQIRLDVAQDTQSETDQGLAEQRSALADTPLAEAITQLVARQSGYEASLLATSRLLETSLVNFLR